jgi:membrane protease YdiL (CAAX protease family)
MEIEEIKNLWKEQKARDVEIKSSEYYSSLLEGLIKNEEKTKRNYILMSIAMIITIFVIDKTAIENIPGKTVTTWAGVIMIYLAIVGIIFVSWATVIKVKINNVTESSLEFLKMARRKLRLRNKIRTVGIPVYIGLLTLGITLTYIQITAAMKPYIKVIVYSAFYLFIIIITVISLKKEKKKYLKNVKPIEDKIDTLLNEQ